MTGRVVTWLVIAVCSVLLLCSGLFSAVFVGGGAGVPAGCYLPADPSASASNPPVDLTPPAGGFDPVGDWNSEQVGNAATIVTVGIRLSVPPRGWVIAVATAMQESHLVNLPNLGEANDHDSLGLFQQRPSQGWGSQDQLMNPVYASTKFYQALLRIESWQAMPLTDAAQAVQKSAYPDAYTKWEDDATTLVGTVGSSGERAMSVDLERCPSNCPAILSKTDSVDSSTTPSRDAQLCEWVAPVDAPIVSGFRTAERPGHDGVDLGAARGTPIRVASSGRVLVVQCNITPASYGCDRDGSPLTPGCGWYTDVQHADQVITRYCHMLSRPAVVEGQQVVAGQVIGYVGSSGHSSGPHLHFEVHLHGDRGPSGAVDAVRFMADRAPIGRPSAG
ncbi:M23 family metallopeptidase [Micromonospora sp. CPCC 205371]|nr:M23 family metallopeptidase [Micromonospora sp. CPCC 205371]